MNKKAIFMGFLVGLYSLIYWAILSVIKIQAKPLIIFYLVSLIFLWTYINHSVITHKDFIISNLLQLYIFTIAVFIIGIIGHIFDLQLLLIPFSLYFTPWTDIVTLLTNIQGNYLVIPLIPLISITAVVCIINVFSKLKY